MSMGPGGMGQSGGHAPSNLNDNMAPGLPPAAMMQSQMSNGEILHTNVHFSDQTLVHVNFSFPYEPRLGVHTYGSILLSVPRLEPSSDPDFACMLVCGYSSMSCLSRCLPSLSSHFPQVCSADGPIVRFVCSYGEFCFVSVSDSFFTHAIHTHYSILLQPRKLPVKDELNVGP